MSNSERVRALNDAFRADWGRGRVVITAGVARREDLATLFQRVKSFSDFSDDNDPYGEHDFGAFEHEGDRFFWKIDSYDRQLVAGSEDPADEQQTTRVLTLIHASEY